LNVSWFSSSFLLKRQYNKFEYFSSQPLLIANTSHRLPQPPEISTSQSKKIAYIFTSPGLLNSDVSTELTTYIFKGLRILEEFFLVPFTLEHEGGTFLLNVRNQNPGTQRNNPGDLNRQHQCCSNFRTRKTAENSVMNFVQFVMNM